MRENRDNNIPYMTRAIVDQKHRFASFELFFLSSLVKVRDKHVINVFEEKRAVRGRLRSLCQDRINADANGRNC
jgi:hypothetical protein